MNASATPAPFPRGPAAAGIGRVDILPSMLAATREAGAKRPTILVVEDEREMRELIAQTLAGEGRIIMAGNGREAIEVIHLDPPDLVVTDVRMPLMSGEDLVAHIRSDATLDGVPVLVLTARPAADNKHHNLLLTATQDYVTKPFQVDELRTRVRDLLIIKLTRDALRYGGQGHSQDVIQLARALALRSRELEQANQAKDHFIAVLSHEMRTPLASALHATELLDSPEAQEPGSVSEMARLIRRNLELQTRLVDDLLYYTGIVKGKLHLELGPVDLHQTLHHTLAMCDCAVRKKHLALETRFAARSHVLLGDVARLVQVISNIVLNAVKFTPAEGRILMRTCNPAPGRWRLEVIDSGIGMTPDLLPKIFDPFLQGATGAAHTFGGLGLGLSVARGLVEAHGGAITASSEGPDRGTCMTVEFDVVDPDRQDPASTSEAASRVSGPLQILLVEDHLDSRWVFAQTLHRWGHAVIAVGTAADAAAAAAEQSFDVLISDTELPDGTGMALLKHLGAHRPRLAIAVSVFDTQADKERSREAGFDRHLIKPIHVQQLREALGIGLTRVPLS